jgi:hypothetical protein
LNLKVDKVAGGYLQRIILLLRNKLAALTGNGNYSFTSSRNIIAADVNNVIECTTSATTCLVTFGVMAIGDTVNLEAHNGDLNQQQVVYC